MLSHQLEDPHRIVGKLLLENLYTNKQTSKSLDPRGIFIVVSKDEIWIWIGAQMIEGNMSDYMNAV